MTKFRIKEIAENQFVVQWRFYWPIWNTLEGDRPYSNIDQARKKLDHFRNWDLRRQEAKKAAKKFKPKYYH